MTTITQAITALPTPPSTSSPATFAALADAFIAAMATLAVELETFRGQVNTVTGEANTNAGTATTKAGEAAASALLADADATQTAADRVQTGLDRIATAADRVQTALDRAATAADVIAVDLALQSASVPGAASQAEAEAGTEVALRAFSPLRVSQAITALAPAVVPPASQAEMETATSVVKFTTPGRQQFHPSAAKAWLKCDVAGAVQASYNVTSVTDGGAGVVTVTIATDFSSADYAVVASPLIGSATAGFTQVNTQAAGSFKINCYLHDGTLLDPTSFFATCFGDQA